MRYSLRWMIVAVLGFVLFQGFQCGSPEFTGAKVQMQQKNYKEAIRLLEIEVQKNPQNEEAWYFLGGLKGDEGELEGMNEAFNQALKLSNLHAKEIHQIRFSKWGQHLNAGVSYLEKAGTGIDTATTLRVGMTESEVEGSFGEPTRKVEAVYEQQKSVMWVYERDDADLYFIDGQLKGWTKTIGKRFTDYYGKSIDELNKAIRAWPDTSVTYRYLGYAYNNKGDLDGAAKAFQKAWDVSKDGESIKRLGRIYIVKGNDLKNKFETANAENLKAVKTMEEVKRTTRKNDSMRILGAPDNVKKGPRGTKKEDWTYNAYSLKLTIDGERVIEKTYLKPFSPKVDSTYYLAALKEFSRAIEALGEAKNADPAVKTANLTQGMSEIEVKELLGEPSSKTEAVYEQAKVTQWDYPNWEAKVYFDQGKVKGWVRPAPDNEVLNMILSAYVESNRVAEAAREFRQALKNDPTNATNHYIMGVLHRTMGEFDDAVAEFKEAVRLDTSNVEALFDIGATYYNWGVDLIRAAEDKGEETDAYKAKFEEALPYMERVANKKGDDAQVWETLGTIYARLGQQDNALKAFDKADKIRQGR